MITLCFGCRAVTHEPVGPADHLGDYDPREWEKFTCERCGVTDVRPKTADQGDDDGPR